MYPTTALIEAISADRQRAAEAARWNCAADLHVSRPKRWKRLRGARDLRRAARSPAPPTHAVYGAIGDANPLIDRRRQW
jgi:hypothetical protein